MDPDGFMRLHDPRFTGLLDGPSGGLAAGSAADAPGDGSANDASAHDASAHDAFAPRRIWLCADDYGISAAVNAAIRDLLARQRLNATSVMVIAPSFHRSEAQALAQLNRGAARVAIGLHLTLTAPFRPLSDRY